MSEPLRFYFDYVSPYAYFAWQWVVPMCERHGLELEPVPVLFAGLLEQWGHLGPAEIPPKRAFIFRDAYRHASLHDIPIALPDPHPFNPLSALRASTLEVGAGDRVRIIDALWRGIWGEGRSLTSDKVTASILSDAGFDGDALVASTKAPEVKQRLFDNTASFIEEGGFGVPGVIYGGELFWGNDQRAHVERWLTGERGYDPDEMEALIAREFGVKRARTSSPQE